MCASAREEVRTEYLNTGITLKMPVAVLSAVLRCYYIRPLAVYESQQVGSRSLFMSTFKIKFVLPLLLLHAFYLTVYQQQHADNNAFFNK